VHDVSLVLGSGGTTTGASGAGGYPAEGGGGSGGTGAAGAAGAGGADGGSDAGDATCDAYTGPTPGPDAGAVTFVSLLYYRPYCSLSWAGGATLVWGSAPGDDPCANELAMKSGATIQRAGLYAIQGQNSVLEHCGTYVKVYNGVGAAPMLAARADALAHPNIAASCVFTVAPAAMPIFGIPYGPTGCDTDPNADVDGVGFGVFNFDYYNAPVDVTAYGQVPFPPGTTACAVDRIGGELCHLGSAAECGGKAGCFVVSGPHGYGPAYSWKMTQGKPVLAVADGVVLTSWDRDVSTYCTTNSLEKEIYVEHLVRTLDVGIDAGTYEERFVVGYRGIAEREVEAGDFVVQGQEIAKTGNSGCAGGSTLRLLTFRLTNLTGARAYTFQAAHTFQGFNGAQGLISPFGWGAPQGSDPYAWMFIGYQDPNGYAPGVMDPGAFSIALFLPGQAPPHE
jgi:hypothetical protein